MRSRAVGVPCFFQKRAISHRYGMRHQNFSIWLEARRRTQGPLVPEIDKIAAIIVSSGASGVTYRDIQSRVRLDRPLINQVLNALLGLGMVTATGNGLGRRFYYCCGVHLGA